MFAWLLFVLVIGLALMLGVERLLERLGIRRADSASAPGGCRDVLRRLRERRER